MAGQQLDQEQQAITREHVRQLFAAKAGPDRKIRGMTEDEYFQALEQVQSRRQTSVYELSDQDLITPEPATSAGRDAAAHSTQEQRRADIIRNFTGWLGEGNYEEAAEQLNGLSMPDIRAQLDKLTPEQIALLHKGAVTRVGPMANAALATGVDAASDGVSWWQAHESLIWDLAKSKGLVILGEQVGKNFPQAVGGKLGGIVGWAIDFATSPGGDTVLPHAIFQAVDPDTRGAAIAVSWNGSDGAWHVAGWHRIRENAEQEAKEYTTVTGLHAVITESYSSDASDPD